MPISNRPWSEFTEASYTPEQYHRACLIHLHVPGETPSKGKCKLPVFEPGGALSRGGVHAAAASLAGARGGVQAPPDAKKRAARRLLALYRELDEMAPESVRQLAS